MLVDPDQGDYRLQPGSPALGYGCQTFAPRLVAESRSCPPPFSGGRTREFIQAGGVLTGDTTWDADTVRVVEDVTIPNGATLSIPRGVSVLFERHYAIHVQGTILAHGAATEPVLFSSSSSVANAIAPFCNLSRFSASALEQIRPCRDPHGPKDSVSWVPDSVWGSHIRGPYIGPYRAFPIGNNDIFDGSGGMAKR